MPTKITGKLRIQPPIITSVSPFATQHIATNSPHTFRESPGRNRLPASACDRLCIVGVALGDGVLFTMANAERSQTHVVCIEDERDMIDLVTLILSKQGIQVHGAEGGKEGLQLVREVQPDLILLDLMMPDMDGWEVYQQIKADSALAAIPVIVVTAKAQSIDKVLGLHIARVDDYITKPFGPQELLSSVERVLQKKRLESR